MSQAQRANVDVKKVDYITDWESERDDIKQQLAPVGIESDKVLENVEKWEHWPQPVMNIIGRTEGGTKVHIVNDEIRPYFYVPMAEYDSNLENDSKVQDVEFGFSNPEGDNMVKVYTRIPGDVPKLRDEYTHHEADILFPNRFLIDAGIEGSISIPAEHANPVPSRVTLDEIESADYNQKTRICFCDIEVDDSHGFPDESRAEEQVISITVYDNYTEEYLIFLYHPEFPEVSHPEAEVILFESELGMLKSFCEYLNRKTFDMITGWNFTDFDMRYLVNRIDLLDSMNSDIDICKEDLSILRSAYDEGYYGAKVKGISVFDMLRAYKNSKFSEADSYSLENVAQEELGEGKIQDNRGIFELWENNPQKLVDYNVKDVKLTVKLEQQQEIIKFFEEIANYVGGRPVECVDASKACDIKLLRTVHGEWAVPSSGQVDGEEFEGGQVFDPITGVRHNVIVLDLKSLYPMSMKTLNAGINTKAEDGALTAPNGISFTTERKAVVVDIIDELLEEREEYKKIRDSYENGSKQYKIYDRKQGAVKIVMNCFSGDTDVMTPQGIVNIKDLNIGDEVYSINPDTKQVEVKEVTDTIEQENQYGRLEHIDTQNADLKITPNHRMVLDDGESAKIEHFDDLARGTNHTIPRHNGVTGDRVENKSILEESSGRFWVDISIHGNTFRNMCPDQLYNEMEYSKNRTAYKVESKTAVKALIELEEKYKDTRGEIIDSIGVQYGNKHSTIPIEYNMDDWLELLGWVISEGSFNSIDSDDPQGKSSYSGSSQRVQIAQKKDNERSKIVDLVDRMGLNYSTDSNGVYLYNSNIYSILKEEVKECSYNKEIPEWVFNMNLPSEQLEVLLASLIEGDGNSTGENSYRYSTASKKLSSDVMKLSVLCGYKVSRSKDSGVWRVLINKNKGAFRPERAETEEHNGKVYCVKIKDNHTLMAGRNGTFQWTGNTLYGMLGWDRFRLYDEETAAAVTATGRDVIKFTKKCAEDEGYEVIYGDTDSIMLELGEDVTEEEAIKIGYELEEHINNLYDGYAKEQLNADEHWFQIEFEKLYRRYFQAGKKKRYAGHIVYKEGDKVDKTDTVGFETERSDYSKFAKDTLEKTLSLITQGATLEELHNHITSRILNLERGNFELDYVGIPSSVSKAFDEYDTKTPGVRGSEYANEHLNGQIQPGDKPKKMFVERNVTDESGESVYPELPSTAQGEKFICFMNEAIIPEEFEWDWETYVDKQIKGPHKRVLEGTRWTWNEILTGKEQPRLDDYQFEDRGSDDSKELVIESDEEDEEDEIVTEVDETASAKLDKAQDLLDRFEDRGGGDGNLEIDMSEKSEEKVDLDTYL